VGVLAVLWRSEPPLIPERELQLIELLSGEAAVAILRTATLSELEKLTRVDALTQIGNRRAFDEQLARELKRAEREGTTVALGMFDLDHFKAYNDAHGHPAGDRMLATVAAIWAGCLRATDSVARYGGEEFALVAPGCTDEEALALVDRLRSAVPEDETCSAGVAVWDGSETPAELLSRADAALYAAKVAGRDQTKFASPRETAPAPTEG
jgi:diguanylate cyclase (GGDEF)-like protein